MERKNKLTGSVQDAVYRSLRRSIINMDLEPGRVISEQDIAIRYKVSRTPVREAFIRLSQEGLINVVPQKVTTISLIEPRRVEQEFFLRETLETAALGLFIERCGPPEFARLEEQLTRQRAAMKTQDYLDFINADDAFHQAVFEGAGQRLAWGVLEDLSGHYRRARLLSIGIAMVPENIVIQHREIMDCLLTKEIDKAAAILKGHLHKLSDEEAMLRQMFPAYFAPPQDGAEDAFNIDFGGFRV